MKMPLNIAILGSTGSIGTQTLEVVRAYPDNFKVVALTAGSNIDLLEAQIREFRPKLAVLSEEDKALELKNRIAGLDCEVLYGMDGLIAAATIDESDMLVTAIVGMIGVRPTVAAIEAHKDIALANKETLVTAGHIIMPLAEKMGVQILPVDSEHSAIYQSLKGSEGAKIERILLTASGGPFRGYTTEQLKHVTKENALKHPNWSMGAKITIDSASLVNKGLEVMEAKWLFGVDYDRVQVVVQPQSIIHSMVEFDDGAIIAELGTPDMKLPIQYALFYGKREFLGGQRLDFGKLAQITFEDPDMDTFLGLKMAIAAGKEGGVMPTVFNAANEVAVARFLRDEISFLDIYKTIDSAMNAIENIVNPDLNEVLETEQRVYRFLEK